MAGTYQGTLQTICLNTEVARVQELKAKADKCCQPDPAEKELSGPSLRGARERDLPTSGLIPTPSRFWSSLIARAALTPATNHRRGVQVITQGEAPRIVFQVSLPAGGIQKNSGLGSHSC